MEENLNLSVKQAKKYLNQVLDKTKVYGRYNSWWFCYSAFSDAFRDPEKANADLLALNLGFYLASWGMYRGSTWLLQHDYKTHICVVKLLLNSNDAKRLWDYSQNPVDHFYDQGENVKVLIDLCNGVVDAYRDELKNPKLSVSDTLVTKILMGTLGCVPAFDKYVKESVRALLKTKGLYLKEKFSLVANSIRFISDYYVENKKELEPKNTPEGQKYPPMKIMDAILWERSFKK